MRAIIVFMVHAGGVFMKTRDITISIKVTAEEALRAHALADLSDESVGRFLRRIVNDEYQRRYGDAPPPAKKTKMGRPRARGGAK